MEENKVEVEKAKILWKHRRSRSTSNLIGGIKTESDDSGKEGKDSEDAERSFAKLTLSSGRPQRPFKLKPSPIIACSNIESDSVNELLCSSHHNGSQQTSKRRRRYKRMAIDCSDEPDMGVIFKEPLLLVTGQNSLYITNTTGPLDNNPIASTSAAMSQQLPHHSKKQNHPHRKKSLPSFLTLDFETGKRKRIGREKSSSDPYANCPSEFQSMIGMGMDLMNVDMDNDEKDELMKSEDDASSVSSGSDSLEPSCDDGQEGDDEQSDWVGDEWREELGESERCALLMRRLRDYVPSREIRAGKRRVHPEKPPFSMRTYANEQVSKFLQDPKQSQLKLHPMRKDERVQLSHIASLYSLDLRSDETGGFPVLTKTPNTTQVVESVIFEKLFPKSTRDQVIMESESDTKRIRK